MLHQKSSWPHTNGTATSYVACWYDTTEQVFDESEIICKKVQIKYTCLLIAAIKLKRNITVSSGPFSLHNNQQNKLSVVINLEMKLMDLFIYFVTVFLFSKVIWQYIWTRIYVRYLSNVCQIMFLEVHTCLILYDKKVFARQIKFVC